MTTEAAREEGLSLFSEPDTLAPHKFSEVYRKKSSLAPEERLMLAVLTDAIDCFQRNIDARGYRGRKLFSETEAWICSRNNSWLYSFERICETLDIDPSYLRLGLMHWRLDHEMGNHARQRKTGSLRYQHTVRSVPRRVVSRPSVMSRRFAPGKAIVRG